jgi:hypothetical protein
MMRLNRAGCSIFYRDVQLTFAFLVGDRHRCCVHTVAMDQSGNLQVSEVVRGVNWIYLPSGVRLLSMLLLGGAGAIGLLVASWLVDLFYFFPHDPIRALAGGIIATVAPYAVYRLALERYNLRASLTNLRPKRLLVLALAYAVANPLLHHIWFALRGDTKGIAERIFAMFVVDFTGALILLYTLKGILALLPAVRRADSTLDHGDGGAAERTSPTGRTRSRGGVQEPKLSVATLGRPDHRHELACAFGLFHSLGELHD